MFTGLVEETGSVLAVQRRADGGARLVLDAPLISRDLLLGDSIAVNGCCLTAVKQEATSVTSVAFDLLAETLRCTNLGTLENGALVNLERSLAVGARMGGHFVQGHGDCAAEVIAWEPRGADYRLEIRLPSAFARYVVAKGSVAMNGISLTVAEVLAESFVLWIIPHTLAVTNLRALKAGDLVNLEFDLLAKYVERLMQK